MLAIGRGLMGMPKLLMLDEPSLGLAPLVVETMFATIEKISAQGMTVIVVEQHIHHVLRICQRGYVLERGRVVHEGSSAALQASDRLRASYLGI